VYDSSFDIKQFIAIVESKPMKSGLVSVNAEALGGDIRRNGHAAVYGIYFDTGKAEVKPESDAALKEIANLLQQDPHLYVVGHTDNQGALDMNLELSKRRADAVLTALTTKFGVAARFGRRPKRSRRIERYGRGPLEESPCGIGEAVTGHDIASARGG
jgi:flagellar motor protein MotB